MRYSSFEILDEVFVISRIIKAELGVISLSKRLKQITLAETFIKLLWILWDNQMSQISNY